MVWYVTVAGAISRILENSGLFRVVDMTLPAGMVNAVVLVQMSVAEDQLKLPCGSS